MATHHDHAYRRMVRSGWPHRRLALSAYGLMAACAAGAQLLRGMDIIVIANSLPLWAAIYAALLLAVARRWQQGTQP